MIPKPQLSSPKGFTLIEVLVVVVVISILMSVIVAGFVGADKEQSFRGFAERMALRVEMARDRAIQTNHEWGVFVEPESIRFAEFDPVTGEWLDRVERPFRIEQTDDDFRYTVKVEAYPGQDALATEDDEDLPAIVLFSSGEVTPFTLTIEPYAWQTRPWLISSDGFTRATTEREDA